MTPKFDAIKIAEVEYKLGALSAKAYFVNTTTGRTHGVAAPVKWSPQVLDKLKELLSMMEEDYLTGHFDDAVTGAKQVQGLGELFSAEDSGANSV